MSMIALLVKYASGLAGSFAAFRLAPHPALKWGAVVAMGVCAGLVGDIPADIVIRQFMRGPKAPGFLDYAGFEWVILAVFAAVCGAAFLLAFRAIAARRGN